MEKNKGNPQLAWSMVNAWISLKLKPADLQKVYEKNVLKGRKVILQKYDEMLKDTPKPLLAKWTYDFFSNNPDAVAKMDNSLNHNDFRRKYLMKLQAETVFRTSYAPLQHFYEILHKFAKKDDEAPQKAQRYNL